MNYHFFSNLYAMKQVFSVLAVLFLAVSFSSVVNAQTDEPVDDITYIEYQKRVDDRSGVLSPDSLARITNAIEIQEKETGLKGFVLVMPRIEEWDFDKYAARQFDYWKSNGIVDSKSYIIIISVEDKKFQVIRGEYIDTHEHDYEIRLLRNRMIEDFKTDIGSAITNYINGLGETASLKKSLEDQKKLKEKGAWYMLIGIIILISVFMRMSYKRRREYIQLEEKRKREGPFIE